MRKTFLTAFAAAAVLLCAKFGDAANAMTFVAQSLDGVAAAHSQTRSPKSRESEKSPAGLRGFRS